MSLKETLATCVLRMGLRERAKRWLPLLAVTFLGASAVLRALGHPEAADAIDAAAKALGLDPESAHIVALASLFAAGAAALAGASAKTINLYREARGEPALPEPAPTPAMSPEPPQFLALFNALTAEGVPRDAAGRAARKALGLDS